jgi:hypothetical protein
MGRVLPRKHLVQLSSWNAGQVSFAEANYEVAVT